MKDLTPRQIDTLLFIKQEVKKYENTPSFRRIARHIGIRSPYAVLRHINGLVFCGYLIKNKQGNYQLTGK